MYVCMTRNGTRKHVVKADVTRCHHKKINKKPQSKNVTRRSGTSLLFSIDVFNVMLQLNFVVASKIWMFSFCSWAVVENFGCNLPNTHTHRHSHTHPNNNDVKYTNYYNCSKWREVPQINHGQCE
jgi:hypothetical protein